MVKISLAYSALFLMLLSGASYATGIGSQGKENPKETAANDKLATARESQRQAQQRLLAENEKLVKLLDEVQNDAAQFKTIGAGATAEDAPRIVQERNELMRKIERSVILIRTQEELVNEAARADAREQNRVQALEKEMQEGTPPAGE